MDDQSTPEAQAASGRNAYDHEDYNTAASTFEQAAVAYESAGELVLAAEMRNNSSVAYLKAGYAKQALEVLTGSIETFARVGDRKKQALALGNQAAALEALHRSGEALDSYKQSSQILKEIGDHEYRPFVLKAITALQVRTGRPIDALSSQRVALDNKTSLTLGERLLKKLLDIVYNLAVKQ